MRQLMGALFVLGMLNGCSGSEQSTRAGFVLSADTLHGSFGGKPFVYKSAVASASANGTWTVSIFQVPLTCADPTGFGSMPSITAKVPWTDGAIAELSSTVFAEFDVHLSTGVERHMFADFRVEVVSAPANAGSTAKLRLRGGSGADVVEGEVTVEVCGP